MRFKEFNEGLLDPLRATGLLGKNQYSKLQRKKEADAAANAAKASQVPLSQQTPGVLAKYAKEFAQDIQNAMQEDSAIVSTYKKPEQWEKWIDRALSDALPHDPQTGYSVIYNRYLKPNPEYQKLIQSFIKDAMNVNKKVPYAEANLETSINNLGRRLAVTAIDELSSLKKKVEKPDITDVNQIRMARLHPELVAPLPGAAPPASAEAPTLEIGGDVYTKGPNGWKVGNKPVTSLETIKWLDNTWQKQTAQNVPPAQPKPKVKNVQGQWVTVPPNEQPKVATPEPTVAPNTVQNTNSNIAKGIATAQEPQQQPTQQPTTPQQKPKVSPEFLQRMAAAKQRMLAQQNKNNMNLTESLRNLSDKLANIKLVEDKGHLDHPEDLVFLQDVAGANQALNNILATAKNPNNISIKWDGYPALIFGRGPNGKFSIMDKHMFNKKDGSGRKIYSPADFAQYDAARGVNRGELERIISEIWSGLEIESRGTKGYYWGDLLFHKPLTPNNNGLYSFKANPNGITYTVDPNSELGKLMTKKVAGIAVHQYIDPNADSTDQAVSLNGGIGNLKNNNNVAIIPSAMPAAPKLKADAKLVKKTKDDITKYGADIQQLMTTAPQARNTFNQLFTTFINKKVKEGNLKNLYSEFVKYFEARPMTAVMKQKLTNHLKQNKRGVVGAFTVWIDLYNLKEKIVHQLNQAAKSSPVQGYLNDGTASQEGFVANGLKFVDRMGFSRQNLQGR